MGTLMPVFGRGIVGIFFGTAAAVVCGLVVSGGGCDAGEGMEEGGDSGSDWKLG